MAKVLILHNNKSKLKKLHHAFVAAGHEVLIGTGGKEGESLFHEEAPECIITDLLLSGMQGGDLSLAIKNTEKGLKTPIILTSPLFRNMRLEENAKTRWKVDRFFAEPYDVHDIVVAAEALMQKFQEQEEAQQEEADQKEAEQQEEIKEEPKDEPVEPPAEEPSTEEAPAEPERVPVIEVPPLEEPPAQQPEEKEDDLFGDESDSSLTSDFADIVSDIQADVTDEKKKPATQSQEGGQSTAQQQKPASETPSLAAFPPEGSLEDISIPEIFAIIFRERKEGILEISSDGKSKNVYFKQGEPIYIESDFREETLGQLLVRHGIISEETAFVSLQNMAAYGKKQGGTLLEMGAITPMQLYQGLKIQMREKILSLFAWFEGKYYFDEGVVDSSSLTVFEIDPIVMLLDGISEYLNPKLIRGMFDEIKHFRIRLAMPPREMAKLRMPDSMWSVIDLIDGQKSVDEVREACGLDVDQASQILYVTLLLGIFEKIMPTNEEEIEKVGESEGEYSEDEFDFDALPSEMLDELLELTPEELGLSEEEEEAPSLTPTHEPIPEAPDERAKPALEPLAERPEDIQPEPEPEPEPEPKPKPKAKPKKRKTSLDALNAQEINTLDKAFKDLESRLAERRYQRETKKVEEKQLLDNAELNMVDKRLRDRILSDYLALDNVNNYEILGLERHATDKEIKDRYRQLAKELHEDKLRGRFDQDIIDKAGTVMGKVTEAYRTLSDPKRRRQYDRRLTDTGQETRELHISQVLIAEHEYNLGLSAMNRGDFAIAKKHFQKAVDFFPEESIYHAQLGWAIYKSPGEDRDERSTRAVQLLEKAVKINPKSDQPYYYLGVVLKENGLKEKAAKMFMQAFRYNRNNTKALEALKLLQKEKEIERRRALKRAGRGGAGDDSPLKELLSKDMDLKSVKKAFLKLFM